MTLLLLIPRYLGVDPPLIQTWAPIRHLVVPPSHGEMNHATYATGAKLRAPNGLPPFPAINQTLEGRRSFASRFREMSRLFHQTSAKYESQSRKLAEHLPRTASSGVSSSLSLVPSLTPTAVSLSLLLLIVLRPSIPNGTALPPSVCN